MKKIFTLLMLGSFFSGLLAQKQVTFKVDMNNYTGGSYNTVYVAGNFGNEWCGNCNALSDANADGVWEGTFTITKDSIEYKFIMDNWAKQESLTPGSPCTKTTGGYTNRFVKLTGNTTLSTVCFESCSACTPVNNKSVTFSVNMKQYTGTYSKVYVSGDFNIWNGNSNELLDADGDKIYSATFNINKDSIEYKFTLDNWIGQESLTAGSSCTKTTGIYTNRFVKLPGSKVLNTVCWNSCSECTNDVTFKVDMTKYKGAPFTGVFVNGSFNGWCGSCNPMSDPDKDGIWEVKLPLPQDSIEYLFTLDTWRVKETMAQGSSCTKTTAGYTNRFLKITSAKVLDAVCFESCLSCANTKDKANVTFKVDMSKNTSTFTTVNINGTFNSWCGNCNPLTDANNDKIYEITLPINAKDTFEYLFTLDGWAAKETFTGGESCTKTTGQFTNRIGVVNGDSAMPAVCWEKCVSCATAGNNTIAASGVKVFPNPGSGRFNVSASFSNLTSGNIKVFDVVGQKLYSKGFTGKAINTEINLNSAKPGMYLMVINTAEGSHQERIFINSK